MWLFDEWHGADGANDILALQNKSTLYITYPTVSMWLFLPKNFFLFGTHI